METRGWLGWPGGLALAAATVFAPSAFAELGGTPTLGTVAPQPVQRRADAASNKMATTEQASTATDWHTREATQADGLVEREYLTADGKVFAVAWRGPHRPELSVLLGMPYATQMSANARALRQQGQGSHRTTSQSDEAFAVRASTRQRLSSGVAWLPSLLPPGVDPGALSIAPGS
ncbi:DUF2844 domain-containing protein [Variovorax sp. H27-G14]|uniref:DUF2844 domain-containing protein n=1 Tax=Variovorax sp. H27-G14 TaxID=3111914 RepID=UPI0038FC83F0